MASEERPAAYNDEDDDENEPLNDVAVEDDEDDVVGEDSESDINSTSSHAAPLAPTPITTSVIDASTVTLAIPAAVHHHNINTTAPTSSIPVVAPTSIHPDPNRQPDDPVSIEKRPIDDSRRLFQRLWTDDDEIELLQGFLEYLTQRGMTSSGHHHHDTNAFYDQIKSKLQLDFNKNQLVEKLRRLKKKYRNTVSRISSGKDFVFKSAHDQATFEISKRIWSNSAATFTGRTDFDDDDQNPNLSLLHPNYSDTSNNNSMSNVSLLDHHNRALVNAYINASSPEKTTMMIGNPRAGARKRARLRMEEKSPTAPALGASEAVNVNATSTASAVAGGFSPLQGLIEETVRNCLSPLLKEMINNAVNGPLFGENGGRDTGGLALNAIPLNFAGLNSGINGEMVDEKWRKQRILELEVYSKRLELVLDQIKSTLVELRSIGGS